MYNQYFGLQEDPFRLTSDPEFLYLTAQHREALAGLAFAILARKGIVVLTGAAGTGKTTILAQILRTMPAGRVPTSMILNPVLSAAEFLESVLIDFGLKEVPVSKALRIAALQTFLSEAFAAGKIPTLIVDEAHKLTPELLEEIRLLGNFESAKEKLLQIVLVGQSELDTLIGRDDLRQFKQRISLHLHIEPLPEKDVEAYVQFRWTKAGGTGSHFSQGALVDIGRVSQGIPRVINVLCDNALMAAYGGQAELVTRKHVLASCRELQLPDPSPLSTTEDVPAPPEATDIPPVEFLPMKTLARYETASARRSLLSRLIGRLKFTQRTELREQDIRHVEQE